MQFVLKPRAADLTHRVYYSKGMGVGWGEVYSNSSGLCGSVENEVSSFTSEISSGTWKCPSKELLGWPTQYPFLSCGSPGDREKKVGPQEWLAYKSLYQEACWSSAHPFSVCISSASFPPWHGPFVYFLMCSFIQYLLRVYYNVLGSGL